MRGKVVKLIRKLVYKGKDSPTTYDVFPRENNRIVCTGLRRQYQDLKHAYSRRIRGQES